MISFEQQHSTNMEVIFSNAGFSHISDKVVKYLPLKAMSNLSKTSKSMAAATARFWFPRFLNKFHLDPQLEQLYANLMLYPNSEIQQSLGYIMRYRVEHGNDVFCYMSGRIQLQLEHDLLHPTNCPLNLSIILNQEPLAQLILSQLNFIHHITSQNFSTAVKLGILGYSSLALLKKVLPFYEGSLELPMLKAICNEKQANVEFLFDQCKVPNSQEMKYLSIKSWKYTNYSWSYYAAIYGNFKILQTLIVLEGKSPLPLLHDEQFLFLSEIIHRGSTLFTRYFYNVYKL